MLNRSTAALAARLDHRFCQRVVEALNLPPEAWRVKVKPATKDAL